MAKRNLRVRYVSLDLALSRVDSAEGLQAWGWDSPIVWRGEVSREGLAPSDVIIPVM